MKRVIVQFTKNIDMYMAGEQAAFASHIAEALAERKLASVVGDVVENNSDTNPILGTDIVPAKKFSKAAQ